MTLTVLEKNVRTLTGMELMDPIEVSHERDDKLIVLVQNENLIAVDVADAPLLAKILTEFVDSVQAAA